MEGACYMLGRVEQVPPDKDKIPNTEFIFFAMRSE
jgi:hypothetical protein